MAGNDILRKFEVDEIKFNKGLITFKVIYYLYNSNSLQPTNTIIVWKKLKDLERFYNECEKLRLALYIKESLPPFKNRLTNKNEFDRNEIEAIKKSFLTFITYIADNPCFYRNKIFTKFFNENELKIDGRIRSEVVFNQNSKSNSSKESIIDSFVPDVGIVESFPIPFQHLNDNQKLKKFETTLRKSDQDSSNNNSYLVNACHLICQAQLDEEKQEYESAFETYKYAISILLKGVKHEHDRNRKLNVKKKVEKYLSKAEEIYNQHLIKIEKSSTKKFSLDTPYEQIMKDEIYTEKNTLSKYKLLSISNKVQIVYDLKLCERFAIKVVHKLNNYKKCFVFPKKIPNMIQLYQIHENDYAYFLILEYFNCSRLSNILDEIRQRLSPCVECLEPTEQVIQTNDQSQFDKFDDQSEDIFLNKEKFDKDEEEYYLSRSNSVKALSEIDDDLFDHSDNSRMTLSKSEQKLSGFLPHSKSSNFNQTAEQPTTLLSGIFDRARNLMMNVNQTIRNTTIEQANIAAKLDNIDLQCNLNNYILERINDKLLKVYYCDQHLNKQLNELNEDELESKMLFAEDMIRKWLWQIVISLESLHDHGLLYINLNPSKILSSLDLQDVCLAYKYSLDYKLIAQTEKLNPLNISQLIVSSFYSTYSSSSLYSYYVAPELYMYGNEITKAVDFWSLGCLAYELLANRPLGSFIPSINCKSSIQFPKYLSIEAKDLIDKLLQINPSERINSAETIKIHPFFKPL